MNANFKDLRLIEAFDYIDPKYIAEVGESLKLRSVQDKEYVKPTFGKQIKQVALLVGCLLLLSCAFPVFNYVLEVINSMAAGWGSGTENVSDTLEIPETTEELVSDFDPNYVLTEEDRARFAAVLKKEFNKKEVNWNIYHFYGKCGDSIIYWNDVWTCMYREVIIEDYVFATPNGERIQVQNGESIYTLEEAYEKGIVTYADIVQINKAHLMVFGIPGSHIGDITTYFPY